MIRVLLDACVPHWLRKHLTGFAVETAHFAGLDHLSDSALLHAIEARFDVLVTMDRNMAFQQSLSGRSIALVVLQLPDQSPDAFRALIPALNKAIAEAGTGTVLKVQI
jgi:predicted nuclease of predicted toxin-antitoxin system